MGQIPADASLWDSGDWIDWHRKKIKAPELTIASAVDDDAKLIMLQVNLAQAARGYHELTGGHLEVYDQIARLYAARHFGVPLTGGCPVALAGVYLVTLRPDAPELSVEVDLSLPFSSVLIVRINDKMEVEGRMMTRRRLGEETDGTVVLKWRNMPRGR
ncbi:MAG: hypothetical protein AAF636_19920 [Pseudomonadota bacterium]